MQQDVAYEAWEAGRLGGCRRSDVGLDHGDFGSRIEEKVSDLKAAM